MRSRWLSVFCLIVTVLALLGCRHASEELAKLESKSGGVDRDTAKQQGAWEPATIGVGFVVGDGVRTAGGAKAHLKLSDGSALSLQEKTLLRFLASPPGKKSRGLDVQSGEVELDVGATTLEIDTPSGPALLEPGARLRLSKTDRGTRFLVEIGAAHLTDLKRNLAAGDEVEIGIGSAVIERGSATAGASESRPGAGSPAPSAAEPAASALEAGTSAAPSGSAVAGDEDEHRAHGPEVADMWISPGESLIVHDPHPPMVIGFAGTRCHGLTLLEVGAKKRVTVGSGRVTAALPAGAQRYRLRCDGDKTPLAEGTVSVLTDSGSRRLASAAPSNRIDADGRRYTILYQSLLPTVSVRWPNSPGHGPFTLFLSSQGKGQKQFSAAAGSYSLTAGLLTEGTHELWFAADGEQSRRTTVVVQFDNAAPTASISSPPERGFAPGATVTVAGVALPGWSVSVAGRDLAQDNQQRFSAEIGAPADSSALAIRFANPQRGVHYYLRRPSH